MPRRAGSPISAPVAVSPVSSWRSSGRTPKARSSSRRPVGARPSRRGSTPPGPRGPGRVVEGRAEVLAHDPGLRGAHSTWPPPAASPGPAVTAEIAVGLVRVGGLLVVSEPPEPADTGAGRRSPSGSSGFGPAVAVVARGCPLRLPPKVPGRGAEPCPGRAPEPGSARSGDDVSRGTSGTLRIRTTTGESLVVRFRPASAARDAPVSPRPDPAAPWPGRIRTMRFPLRVGGWQGWQRKSRIVVRGDVGFACHAVSRTGTTIAG